MVMIAMRSWISFCEEWGYEYFDVETVLRGERPP